MTPRPRSDLNTRVIDNEVVILDRANGNIHRLNATASAIWNLCDGRNTPEEISRQVAASFQLTPADVLPDVLRTVEDFQRLNLLDNGEAGPETTGVSS
jgi:Coenzyme PQQ synthesis protein D (PqqD)